jgi:hypothetical protein
MNRLTLSVPVLSAIWFQRPCLLSEIDYQDHFLYSTVVVLTFSKIDYLHICKNVLEI